MSNPPLPPHTIDLRPPSTLLMGPGGTGKTTSICTLLACGLAVRMLATEPTAPNRVIQECIKRNIDYSRFHWCLISPTVPKWGSLIEAAKLTNTFSLAQLADLKGGIAKQDGQQWIKMLENIANFRSDRNGQEMGDATEWDPDTAFVIDGLTGLSDMARLLTVGLKPNPAPGEWGVMQQHVLNLIKKLCADCNCFFVLIAHVEREANEITGMPTITASTLGAKLAPKLPPQFTTVIYAKRDKDKFLWDTAAQGADTKQGDLPFQENLPPDFRPIVEGFRTRLKAAQQPSSSSLGTAKVS